MNPSLLIEKVTPIKIGVAFSLTIILFIIILLLRITSSLDKDMLKLKDSHLDLEKNISQRTKALELINAKDEAILTSVGDGLIVTGKDGNIILVNRAFENIMGWKASQVQGKLLVKIVSIVDEKGNDIKNKEHPVMKTLKDHEINNTNAYYKRQDGTFFPVVTTISPVIVNKEFIGTVEVFRDITKEKEIDKAKTEFVSLASHQLRTPLSAINWYTEMLLDGDAGKITKEQKKYLDEIYTGNQRMVELVNALLDVSRLELGTLVIDPQPTDVIKIAESVISEEGGQVKSKNLNLKFSFSKKMPILQLDPKLIRVVFQNLLSNAVKYTPPGGEIKFDLSIKKDQLIFTLSDTGYGISEHQQDKIFTKLFRADNVIEKDTEGTGLGLYLVKSIIENSGGKIWFESKENMGTTFYVSLPMSGMKKTVITSLNN